MPLLEVRRHSPFSPPPQKAGASVVLGEQSVWKHVGTGDMGPSVKAVAPQRLMPSPVGSHSLSDVHALPTVPLEGGGGSPQSAVEMTFHLPELQYARVREPATHG